MGRIICGVDIETTGLDLDSDSITEIAWVIRDTDDPKPLKLVSLFVRPAEIEKFEISDEVYDLTKITKRHVVGGLPLESVLLKLSKDLETFGVEAIVAHNGEYFDKPFILSQLGKWCGYLKAVKEQLSSILWIDTSTDLLLPKACRQTNLTFLAAFHGFLNPFPHAALSDVQTMLKILDEYDIERVFEQARSPWVVVKALVSFDDKHLARARRYYWEKTGDRSNHYPKQWVKRVRAIDLQKEKEEAPFQVVEVL